VLHLDPDPSGYTVVLAASPVVQVESAVAEQNAVAAPAWAVVVSKWSVHTLDSEV